MQYRLALALLAGASFQVGATEPAAPRQQALVHLVRQDCGSCHGLTLKGGLGPALTPMALAGRSEDTLITTIIHGRPGTPMPPFKGILDDDEARWIARQLLAGFPQGH